MEYVWTIYGVSYKKNQTATLPVINIDAARTLPTNLHELYIKYNKECILRCPP